MSAAPTPIKARRNDAVFYSVATAAALAGAVYFQRLGRVSGVLGCLGAALVLASAGLLLGGEAACPHCAAAVAGLSPAGWRAYARCGACRRYLGCASGRLTPLSEEHVAPRAEFSVPLEAPADLPLQCCSCGRPAQRFHDLVHTAAVRTPGLPAGKPVDFKAAAPFCEEHFGDATLGVEDLAPYPGIGVGLFFEPPPPEHRLTLKVRSYGFYLRAAKPG